MLSLLHTLGVSHYHYCEDALQTSPERLASLSAQAGLRISAVDPFNAFPEAGAARTEANCLALYARYIDFAARCGAGAICFQAVGIWAGHFDAPREGLVRCVSQLTALALKRGVQPVYEIVNRYESPLIHTVGEALDTLAAPLAQGLRLVLDSFHLQIEEPDPVDAIAEALPYLHEYQISDSNRGAIGEGHIPFAAHKAALDAGGYERDVIVETVLPECGYHQPPANAQQLQRLAAQQRQSVHAWTML
nr:sugar phosphate isomerase/epimerase family protein [Solimonas marina]